MSIETPIGSAAAAIELAGTRTNTRFESTTVEWLIDNAEAYRETLAAIARARNSIWITQLAFDADCRAYDTDETNAYAHSLVFDALVRASQRSVTIHIALNATRVLDTAKALRVAIQRAGATGMSVRGISCFPQLLHTKMLIVDEREAILLGSPFVNGYWDSSDHPPSDGRRPTRELGGRPLHDLSIHVTGAPVHSLSAIFAELWNDVSVGDDADAPIECSPSRAHDENVRVVRTAPAGALRRNPAGLTEILSAIEREIETARRLIYVEHQYLSSRRVIDALAGALARASDLEIVVTMNQNPDVTAYRGWQNARLREAGFLSHPRVGLFTLWRALPSPSAEHRWIVNQVFVHSKALVVDDECAIAGSANLDGVSLHSYGHDFTGWIGRRVFRSVRNFDVNLVVRGAPSLELREQLWSEHLGLPRTALRVRPAGGWLRLWRERAADAVRMLGAPPVYARDRTPVALVLPYSERETPAAQLRDLGIPARGLDVRFDPGWIERRLSPNWLRNTFA